MNALKILLWDKATREPTIALCLVCVAGSAGLTRAEDFSYTTASDGTITITNYSGPGGAVNIPATIDNRTVTRIGQSTFLGNLAVTSVAMPDTVCSIENGHTGPRWWTGAFRECRNLTNITLGNNLTNIG